MCEQEAGESDKRLVLLCKSAGKLLVYARGARKAKSKMLAASQLFTYGDFVINDGGNFLSVGQAEPIERFNGICADYDKTCAAHYAAEICDRTTLPATECDGTLRLLLKTLSVLAGHAPSAADAPPRQTASVFLLRFFLCYGIAPEIDRCCVCGAPVQKMTVIFFCDEGTLCGPCRAQKPFNSELPLPSHAALKHVMESDLNGAFFFTLAPKYLDSLQQAARLMWKSHFDIQLKSEPLLG